MVLISSDAVGIGCVYPIYSETPAHTVRIPDHLFAIDAVSRTSYRTNETKQYFPPAVLGVGIRQSFLCVLTNKYRLCCSLTMSSRYTVGTRQQPVVKVERKKNERLCANEYRVSINCEQHRYIYTAVVARKQPFAPPSGGNFFSAPGSDRYTTYVTNGADRLTRPCCTRSVRTYPQHTSLATNCRSN